MKIFKPVEDWLKRLWGVNEPTAQAEYDAAIEAIFNNDQGAIVLRYWLSEIYFQRDYIPNSNQSANDVMFHLGQREFIQAILETLDRIQYQKREVIKVDSTVDVGARQENGNAE